MAESLTNVYVSSRSSSVSRHPLSLFLRHSSLPQLMYNVYALNFPSYTVGVLSCVTVLKSDKHIALPYPSICLLIASVHADTTGQQAFTFEMLYETFRDQVRASTSAPVQLRGGSIGMVRCSRQVLMIVSPIIFSRQQSYVITQAFENLVAMRAFVPVVAYAQSVAKEFVKYRSVVEREDVRKAVEKMSQVNLKKWLTKATQ